MSKILIVDDDPHIRELIRVCLQNEGFDTCEAADGAMALYMLATTRVDMVILDVMMPGEDGVALTGSLRETMQTPILLLTARGDADDRISGLEAGAESLRRAARSLGF